MTFNEGTWDRVIRILVGFGLGYAAWVTWPGTATLMTRMGAASLVYLIAGLEVLITGLIGWSPLYAVFGWSTKEKVGA
jgi:hypothetical protein